MCAGNARPRRIASCQNRPTGWKVSILKAHSARSKRGAPKQTAIGATDKKLRKPVFLGLRDDKRPDEVGFARQFRLGDDGGKPKRIHHQAGFALIADQQKKSGTSLSWVIRAFQRDGWVGRTMSFISTIELPIAEWYRQCGRRLLSGEPQSLGRGSAGEVDWRLFQT